MKSYQISFFNELLNDFGREFYCCQRVIEIRLAKSRERAVEAAKRRFERQEKVSNWLIHARSFNVQEITE